MAAERIMAGLKRNTKLNEKEEKIIAYHESGHAVVSWFLEGANPLLKVTIIPRTKGSLGYTQYLPNENFIDTEQELLDEICSLLGGRMSEEFFLGEFTSGSQDDIKQAYKIAYHMVQKFGMNDKIGNVSYEEY